MATASVSDTILITGGTGTGYLNIAFSAGQLNHSSESLTVNGESGQRWYGGIWSIGGVFAFQFGQLFSMDLLASAYDDNGNEGSLDVSLLDARVYTIQPTSCLPGSLCTDPGYTSVPALGYVFDSGSGITSTDAPEPGTGDLVFSLIPFAAALARRRRRGAQTRLRGIRHTGLDGCAGTIANPPYRRLMLPLPLSLVPIGTLYGARYIRGRDAPVAARRRVQ